MSTGIKIVDWLRERLNKGSTVSEAELACVGLMEAWQEVYIRELAFWSAVNLVANSVSKCEFRTYRNHVPVKGLDHWRWNFSPNKNQNSSMFLHKLIGKLYRKNEALVIERAGQLLVADSFTRTHNAVKDDVFTDIEVEELSINRSFKAGDVLFFRLNHNNMMPLLYALNEAYSKLLNTSQKDFQWNSGRHGIMNISTMKAGDPKWIDAYKELLNNFVKPYLESPNSVMPEFSGMTYREEGTSTTRSQRTTRDIKALIDDVFEMTAKAFGIPGVLMRGEVEGTKDAVDNLLTFCIDPLCDQIQEEIVRKQYGQEAFARGDYIRINTNTVKHFEWFANAKNVESLISSGAKSIDDVLEMAGEERLNTEWSQQHFITKNFSTIQDLIALGGENN